jgi:hypothetical protein
MRLKIIKFKVEPEFMASPLYFEQLTALSLPEMIDGLYRIHRLTRTFLLTEVAKW